MSHLTEMIKIADIHAKRVNYALTQLTNLFPISEPKIKNLSEQDFLLLELLISRFAKLQDFMGAKLIDAFLEAKEEETRSITMIDKLNKLEKLYILDDVNSWSQMREARNHLSNEYPDHPEIQVKYLNEMFNLAPGLLLLLENIKSRI